MVNIKENKKERHMDQLAYKHFMNIFLVCQGKDLKCINWTEIKHTHTPKSEWQSATATYWSGCAISLIILIRHVLQVMRERPGIVLRPSYLPTPGGPPHYLKTTELGTLQNSTLVIS